MNAQAKRATFSHRLEYAATRAVVGSLRLVGWRAASWVSGRIARFVYRPLGIRRDVVERQIAAAFPERAPGDVLSLAGRSYESLGHTSIETAIMPGTSAAEILDRVERVEGWHHVEDGLAGGRGVILVTGHLGNWELGGAYFAARGVPLDVVARVKDRTSAS